MTGELSKGYLARVNLQEKGLESAEIILQVNQINPLGNGKYGLIVHDCQNQMKALFFFVETCYIIALIIGFKDEMRVYIFESVHK